MDGCEMRFMRHARYLYQRWREMPRDEAGQQEHQSLKSSDGCHKP